MNWYWHYAGLSETRPSDEGSRVDYSYVFGNAASPAIRHDPHVHGQSENTDGGLLALTELIRERADGDRVVR